MQQRFLAIYPTLAQPQTALTGLWLVHSDEELLLQWLVDGCRANWQANRQIIKRIELTGSKSWQAVIAELSALSLFAESTAIIVTGKHKPDDDTLSALHAFADDAKAGNTAHHLLWLLPKQDKKAQNSKAFKLFDTQGTVIDGNISGENQRQQLLTIKADELGVKLHPSAWQVLMAHTENDLLSAYQTLWRLSLVADGVVDVPQLQTLLADGGSFTVFDLSDALLLGDANTALKIIHHLKHHDTAASIVLWAILKDARIIAAMKQGSDPLTLGVWRNKITAYQRLTRQLSPQAISQLLALGYDIDKAIKGLADDNAWRLLEQAVLIFCQKSTISPA